MDGDIEAGPLKNRKGAELGGENVLKQMGQAHLADGPTSWTEKGILNKFNLNFNP